MTDTWRPPGYPKQMYHASKDPVIVYSKRQEVELGPDWSEQYIHREYPAFRYHWTKPAVIVKNADEDAALGGGWGRRPDAFDQFKGPRPLRTDPQDLIKWVDLLPIPGLSTADRDGIKAALWRADAEFSGSPEPESAALAAMRQAFDGVAKVLFRAGMLTEQLLLNEIPLFVWDSAIAGGWWRLASETPQRIFPERLGRYWVWRDESTDWAELFRTENSKWRATLLEGNTSSGQAKNMRRQRMPDRDVAAIRTRVRNLRSEGLNFQEICTRLGTTARPPRAKWRDLSWPMAYRSHTSAVTKWLSEACS